ncbi:PilZ domain-containing protein [Alteromonas sp. C1M14]|uniref:PilZ domain-containing protein n=1 Tax=Alteromonas sp. C1M14 TaxID=2841567 RepID=UPI001C089306|nr:PilZ domain-containing protein [Alteromonas sp. C1M14]MBU2979074.1 PilZ domain-containing protein [Alteromonas sp. C1M14]
MDKELQQYTHIIDKLKPAINSTDFNQRLSQVTKDLAPEKRFLIKMELKRLAKPCLRSVDLRGQVNGECHLFEYKGRNHYLDEIAIEVFKEQVKIYGHYSFGVYEAIMATENNFKVMRDKKEREAKSPQQSTPAENANQILAQYTIPVVNLLSYAHRGHERMNFAIAVEIKDEQHHSYRATSIDISMEGLRLKIPKDIQFSPEQRLYVYFRGLENEFAMDKRNGIAYNVITTKIEKSTPYLILKRELSLPSPMFDSFLEKFIHGNKRRYKVNLANTVDAIKNKTAEQYISPCSPTLPVFIDKTDSQLVPKYAMINSINQETLAYWQDEESNIRLGYLLKPSRLQWLHEQQDSGAEMYVYSFTHIQNGAVYFYSASSQELAKKEVLKNVYLGFGARKVSWRVFKLSMGTMSAEQAHVALSIPETASTKTQKQHAAPSARLMAKLKNLSYIVHVTDVTSASAQQCYARLKFNRNNLTHLRVFAHPRNRLPQTIQPYRYRFQEQRMETRYLLRSPIKLTNYNDEMPLAGISEDISVSGLRLEVAEEFLGDVGSLVKVSFPKLQSLTTQHDVMGLIYEVIHISEERNLIHLRSAEGETGKIARQFFDNLIKQNKQSLKTYPEEEEIPGMGHALRCINARNTPNCAFLMAKTGIRYTPDLAVFSDNDAMLNQLMCHFTDNKHANVEFLFRDRNLDAPLIQQGLRTMKIENQPVRQELFIAYDPHRKDSRLALIPHLSSRFSDDEKRRLFIIDAMEKGQFVAVQVVLTSTGKPDLDMLQAELNYVSMYAMHIAKELDEKIWSIGASVHLVDTTAEVLTRFGFDRKTILHNCAPVRQGEGLGNEQKPINQQPPSVK